MDKLNALLERKFIRLGTRLIDQKKGRILVEPTDDDDGFWFGGGNCARDPRDGSLLLLGRYRDNGDSRTGDPRYQQDQCKQKPLCWGDYHRCRCDRAHQSKH